MAKAALLGYGTIGSGVAEILRVNADTVARKAGERIELKYILDLRDFPGDINEDKIVHDIDIILSDPEVSVVVEAMGGVEPAYTFTKGALLAGKCVTTSNKALVAKHGAELIAIAKERNLSFLFEASVGGGIPIISPMISCLTANVIEEVTGILNGTTNYMMTRMSEEGLEFDDVLKDAQRKGFAEADPTADIEGYDACRKIAILTSLASEKQVDFEDIPCEGITNITVTDFKYAKALGRSIKLLASSRRMGDTYSALVAPFLLSPDHPLYPVSGVFNAVFVNGNMLGDAMFYGSGAGKLPTASAVVSDIIDMVKHAGEHIEVRWSSEKLVLADSTQAEYAYFVRTAAGKNAVEAAFGTVDYVDAGIEGETAFVTGTMSGAAFEAAEKEIGGVLNRIRLL